MKNKQKVVSSVGRSTPTGLFWHCQANSIPEAHPSGPVANPIKVGPKGVYFVHCACGDHHFFSRAWRKEHGLSLEQVRAMGLTIIGV